MVEINKINSINNKFDELNKLAEQKGFVQNSVFGNGVKNVEQPKANPELERKKAILKLLSYIVDPTLGEENCINPDAIDSFSEDKINKIIEANANDFNKYEKLFDKSRAFYNEFQEIKAIKESNPDAKLTPAQEEIYNRGLLNEKVAQAQDMDFITLIEQGDAYEATYQYLDAIHCGEIKGEELNEYEQKQYEALSKLHNTFGDLCYAEFTSHFGTSETSLTKFAQDNGLEQNTPEFTQKLGEHLLKALEGLEGDARREKLKELVGMAQNIEDALVIEDALAQAEKSGQISAEEILNANEDNHFTAHTVVYNSPKMSESGQKVVTENFAQYVSQGAKNGNENIVNQGKGFIENVVPKYEKGAQQNALEKFSGIDNEVIQTVVKTVAKEHNIEYTHASASNISENRSTTTNTQSPATTKASNPIYSNTITKPNSETIENQTQESERKNRFRKFFAQGLANVFPKIPNKIQSKIIAGLIQAKNVAALQSIANKNGFAALAKFAKTDTQKEWLINHVKSTDATSIAARDEMKADLAKNENIQQKNIISNNNNNNDDADKKLQFKA